jgi:P2 family phage contractile tail tube protein
MARLIPLQVNNYSVWKDGSRFLGMADITLPHLQNMTDEFKGAGYGGTTTYPVQSHYQDWEVTFNFHAISRESLELMRQQTMMLQTMAGIEYQDPSSHLVSIGSWRFAMLFLHRGFNQGKYETGTKQNVAVLGTVTYIKAVYNGETVFEKDKVNMVDMVLGTDYAQPIRTAIGM